MTITIFQCEGVRIYEDDEKRANYSEKESEVLKCRKLFDGFREEAMKNMDLTIQFSGDEGDADSLDYPDDVINIDISYVEYHYCCVKNQINKPVFEHDHLKNHQTQKLAYL